MTEAVQQTDREDPQARLKAYGISPTPQRLEIARRLLSRPQHVSADQVLEWVNADGRRVSKATVYNTLNLFTRKGLLREVIVDPTRVFYDSTPGAHHHFYNVDTGELSDVPDGEVAFSRFPELPRGTDAEEVEVIIRVSNRARD